MIREAQRCSELLVVGYMFISCSERKFDPMSLGSQVVADCLGVPFDSMCSGTQADPFFCGTPSWLRASSEMLRAAQKDDQR